MNFRPEFGFCDSAKNNYQILFSESHRYSENCKYVRIFKNFKIHEFWSQECENPLIYLSSCKTKLKVLDGSTRHSIDLSNQKFHFEKEADATVNGRYSFLDGEGVEFKLVFTGGEQFSHFLENFKTFEFHGSGMKIDYSNNQVASLKKGRFVKNLENGRRTEVFKDYSFSAVFKDGKRISENVCFDLFHQKRKIFGKIEFGQEPTLENLWIKALKLKTYSVSFAHYTEIINGKISGLGSVKLKHGNDVFGYLEDLKLATSNGRSSRFAECEKKVYGVVKMIEDKLFTENGPVLKIDYEAGTLTKIEF